MQLMAAGCWLIGAQRRACLPSGRPRQLLTLALAPTAGGAGFASNSTPASVNFRTAVRAFVAAIAGGPANGVTQQNVM
jgi:nitrate/nitrite transporter NarK